MCKKQLQRLLALIMALMLSLGSVAALADVTAGETISNDSKWINSDIIGAIDETTEVSLKDDFHTAANRDWLLSGKEQGRFELALNQIHERKLSIVLGEAPIDSANADAIGLSNEKLQHNLKLVQTFSSLSGEWQYRNANGMEPALPYLEAISSIQTMDDLYNYLFNTNGMNIAMLSPVTIGVESDPDTQSVYVATITPTAAFTLGSQEEYTSLTQSGHTKRFLTDDAVQYLLGRLGYTEGEIKDILRRCYAFEGMIAENISNSQQQQTAAYLKSAQMLTRDELTALMGSYPILKQLEAYGVAPQEAYQVFEQSFLSKIGNIYQERNLEDIKAMLLVHTLRTLLPLLDEEAYAKAVELFNLAKAVPEMDLGGPVAQSEQELADWRKNVAEFVFKNYLQNYLPGPMDQIYVASYCTPQLKAEILNLVNDTLHYYRSMIEDETWLSEKSRKATIEKLDNMLVRCVYPDHFVDYTGLTFKGCRNNEGGTLPDAVAAINKFQLERKLKQIGQSFDRNYWDMSAPDLSTTKCNAFYFPKENSINILAGYLAGGMYSSDMPYETVLARIGSTIGHEITHAFDTTGYKFDKLGRLNPWWSTEDVEAFDIRASKLIKYYDSLMPYPGALLPYNGSNVSGEAIADMGGVKCMLNLAKSKENFDYDLFFRSYAEVWRVSRDLETEKYYVSDDSHPLAFLRTNVTLMQFDEFQKLYNIQPGDGMYVAPEDRINVW